MNVWATQQSSETISQRYADLQAVDSNPHLVAARDARLQADTDQYHAEKRMKYIQRYLRQRANRPHNKVG